MARIRTIKPDFFRHEGLQDLEAAHPGHHVMLVFAALWCHCDKAGHFPWKPRTLKLDILPFLDFDLTASLSLLCEHGFIKRYEVDGEQYGEVVTFNEHQRISGKEAQEPAKYPEPKEYFTNVSLGQPGEAAEKHPERQEGKGKERERKGDNARAALNSDFEIWYTAYPRKVAPEKAMAAYVKARRKADAATLLAGIETYRKIKPDYADWAHPASWLNAGRWLDQPDAKNESAPVDPEKVFRAKASMVAKGFPMKDRPTQAELERMVRENLVTVEQARKYGYSTGDDLMAIPDFLKRVG